MKRKTIRKHMDFITPPDCLMARGSFFVIKTKPAKIPNDARYGLVVTKKSFKLATQRNHVKRLIRDWIAYNQDLMSPELDYIFILNPSVLDKNRENGRKEIQKAFEKILKLLKNSANKNENQ